MEIYTRSFQTPNGIVEGVQTKWEYFNILIVTGSKGFLACPAIDIQACQGYGKAAALVESSADNPIGTLERFADRKITSVNQQGRQLGIKEGMIASEAFSLIA
ncbi:MAG: DUF1805 domain-containing protein [Planctomycetes bacterium]|nr:DUF1805 domain-containing protein [Planctomycetota bacterium]MBL7107268.1 DUF1805 domain-containing protein [Phycisphaerae bacterium]